MLGSYCRALWWLLERRLAAWRRYWRNRRQRRWFKHELKGNEFDLSLSMDPEKMARMSPGELAEYGRQLAEKRSIAHELDLEQSEKT